MLSREEFKVACCALLDERATSQNPHLQRVYNRWTWKEHSQYPHLGCLSRTSSYSTTECNQTIAFRPYTCEEQNTVIDPEGFAEILESEDPATVPLAASSVPTLHCHMSVVYSPTYQLPAFYCTMFDHNGSALPLERLLRSTLFRPSAFANAQLTSFAVTNQDSVFPLLSHGEHPVTGESSWYLHPCETEPVLKEIMEALDVSFPNRESYLTRLLQSWFMVVATVVDLER